MDPLSGVASVIAVVQITGDVLSRLLKYNSDIKDAESDIQRLKANINALKSVLQQVKDLAKGPEGAKLTTSKKIIEQSALEIDEEFKRLREILTPQKRNRVAKIFLLQNWIPLPDCSHSLSRLAATGPNDIDLFASNKTRL